MEFLKQKLSSRKLWAAVVAAVSSIVAALCGEQLTPEVVDALGYVTAAAAAYIFCEGSVDAVRLIADAIKEKYAIPSVSDIVADIKAAEAAEECDDPASEN